MNDENEESQLLSALLDSLILFTEACKRELKHAIEVTPAVAMPAVAAAAGVVVSAPVGSSESIVGSGCKRQDGSPCSSAPGTTLYLAYNPTTGLLTWMTYPPYRGKKGHSISTRPSLICKQATFTLIGRNLSKSDVYGSTILVLLPSCLGCQRR